MATREYQFIVGPETSTLPTAGTPTDDLDIITKGFADSHYAQGKLSVADITALKAVTNTGSTARVNGDIIEVQSTNAVYVFDSDSALSGNDDTVVTPTAGTGRWLKVGAPIAASTDNRLPKYDGTGGGLQTTGITVDDSNNVTGVNNMTIDGDLTVKGTTTSIETTNLQVEDANILINDGGNDATSEGAGITVERTGTNGSLIYANAATSKFKVGALGSEVEIADISSSQVLTNKTISYASNTITGVQPTSTLTTKGDLYAATASSTVTRLGAGSDGQILVADSTQTTGLKWTTANSGSKNYFIYNSFENNATTGWSLGNVSLTTNFPSGVPTFGSGASGNLSISAVSGSPIAGTYALSYASSAATTAGNFVSSDAFTIDNEDQAKILAFRFSYKVQSGTVDMSGTTSNSFGVAIYDVTNAAWIQPAGVFNLVQNSGIGIATGTFQTSSNGTSYRLLIYNANATSGAVTMYFDTFFVGPQVTSIAPAMSDWVKYTPTITGFGTPTGLNIFSRRTGDTLEVQGYFTSGTPTATQAQLTLGYNGINANVVAADVSKFNGGIVGILTVNKTSTTYFGGKVLGGAGANYVAFSQQTSTTEETTPLNGNLIASSGQFVEFQFKLPIQGWSSNTISSADTDTRVIAAQFSTSTGTITNGGTDAIVPLSTTNVNQGGMVFTSGASANIVIPVSGTYRITTTIGYTNSGITGAQTIGYKINNSATVNIGVRAAPANFDTITGYSNIDLKAGDVVYMIARNPHSSNLTIDGARISIERLSGPAVVQATETVAADAYLNATTTITTNTKVTGWAVNDNSHGAFDTTNSRFVAPVSGRYLATVNLMYNISAFSSSGQLDTSIYKNGTSVGYSRTLIITGTGFINSTVTRVVKLLAGEYLEVFGNKATGTYTVSSHNDANSSTISVVRIGN